MLPVSCDYDDWMVYPVEAQVGHMESKLFLAQTGAGLHPIAYALVAPWYGGRMLTGTDLRKLCMMYALAPQFPNGQSRIFAITQHFQLLEHFEVEKIAQRYERPSMQQSHVVTEQEAEAHEVIFCFLRVLRCVELKRPGGENP